MNDSYLNVLEVSQFLRRSPGAVRNLVLRRKIPFHKPGGRLLFSKVEIEKWIQESPGISLKEIIDGD